MHGGRHCRIWTRTREDGSKYGALGTRIWAWGSALTDRRKEGRATFRRGDRGHNSGPKKSQRPGQCPDAQVKRSAGRKRAALREDARVAFGETDRRRKGEPGEGRGRETRTGERLGRVCRLRRGMPCRDQRGRTGTRLLDSERGGSRDLFGCAVGGVAEVEGRLG